MDLRIRKYIQYRIRTLDKDRRDLEKFKQKREELRKDLIDESPMPQDGQPKGKGVTSSPTENKAIKLIALDKRIGKLEQELKDFKTAEEKIRLMGRKAWVIYHDTIMNELNPEYVAMSIGISERSLYTAKSQLLQFIAEELGEYCNINELEK